MSMIENWIANDDSWRGFMRRDYINDNGWGDDEEEYDDYEDEEYDDEDTDDEDDDIDNDDNNDDED